MVSCKRPGQSRTEHVENLENLGNSMDSCKLGPWGPRWSPVRLSRPLVDFAGGHAETIGKTVHFRLRARLFRSPRPLRVRAGQNRTEHSKNLENP